MAKPHWLTLATHVPESGSGGGMVRVAVEFIRGSTLQSKFIPHVLCQPEAAEFFISILGDPDRVHTIPGPAHVMSMSAYEQFALPLIGHRFDVVHGTKHLLPLRTPVKNRPRLVLTIHDMLFMDRPVDFPGPKGALLRHPYITSIRQADSLTCVSEATRQRLLSYVPSVSHKAKVVALATPDELTKTAATPVKELVGRRFALVVGDDSGRKNLGMLAQAMQMVRQHDPQAVLAVVGGKNWGKTADADYLRSAAASGTILPLGYRTDAELRWCYENTSVVCCPSVLEGFGLPALEARTFKRPLITSDDPALIEVSGAGSVHVGSQFPHEWVHPLHRALKGELPASSSPPPRSWLDFVNETAEGVLTHGA